MILGSAPLGSTAAQLGAAYPFTDTGILGRIIDLVGEYVTVLNLTGSYVTELSVTGSYTPVIDVIGDVSGN